FAPLWMAAPDDGARLRVIIDQVASLTDPAAISWHRRLVGG
ncbi:MAG TPA: deoxyguanosinetriphosphate triphosphohydrolase, partial [Rugosimonospora sp.]